MELDANDAHMNTCLLKGITIILHLLSLHLAIADKFILAHFCKQLILSHNVHYGLQGKTSRLQTAIFLSSVLMTYYPKRLEFLAE